MSLGCLLGRHRPSLVSIVRRGRRLDGLCDGCGLLLSKEDCGRWMPARPLARSKPERAA